MEKVMRFSERNGWYHGTSGINLCASQVKDYLNVHDQFDLHMSTRRPTGQDFYPIVRRGHVWRLEDVTNGRTSPWNGDVDSRLVTMFPKAKRLYVWAME